MHMAGFQTVSVVRGSGPMAKAMSIAGMIVAGLIALIFTADLAVRIPFGRVGNDDRRRLPGQQPDPRLPELERLPRQQVATLHARPRAESTAAASPPADRRAGPPRRRAFRLAPAAVAQLGDPPHQPLDRAAWRSGRLLRRRTRRSPGGRSRPRVPARRIERSSLQPPPGSHDDRSGSRSRRRELPHAVVQCPRAGGRRATRHFAGRVDHGANAVLHHQVDVFRRRAPRAAQASRLRFPRCGPATRAAPARGRIACGRPFCRSSSDRPTAPDRVSFRRRPPGPRPRSGPDRPRPTSPAAGGG